MCAPAVDTGAGRAVRILTRGSRAGEMLKACNNCMMRAMRAAARCEQEVSVVARTHLCSQELQRAHDNVWLYGSRGAHGRTRATPIRERSRCDVRDDGGQERIGACVLPVDTGMRREQPLPQVPVLRAVSGVRDRGRHEALDHCEHGEYGLGRHGAQAFPERRRQVIGLEQGQNHVWMRARNGLRNPPQVAPLVAKQACRRGRTSRQGNGGKDIVCRRWHGEALQPWCGELVDELGQRAARRACARRGARVQRRAAIAADPHTAHHGRAPAVGALIPLQISGQAHAHDGEERGEERCASCVPRGRSLGDSHKGLKRRCEAVAHEGGAPHVLVNGIDARWRLGAGVSACGGEVRAHGLQQVEDVQRRRVERAQLGVPVHVGGRPD
eukprot:scaffold38990_cov26-Tisochrysis_lutea.AAC.4